MIDYPEIQTKLTEALRLQHPPIAVTLTDDPPASIPAFDGRVAAGCVFWERAANGPFVTSSPAHQRCGIGIHTHNLPAPGPDHAGELGQVLGVLEELSYLTGEDLARVPTLHRSITHVVYGPLAKAPIPADLVLLFAHNSQGLVITEATQQVEPDTPPAMGRPACAIVPQTVNSGCAAMSLGCCGARAYLDGLSDDIALWALPGPKLAEYTERIVALSGANQLLGTFHQLRRSDVEAGLEPTVQDSLQRLQSSQ